LRRARAAHELPEEACGHDRRSAGRSLQVAGTAFIVGHPGGEAVELMEAGRLGNVRCC